MKKSFGSHPARKQSRAQGMVEFAMVISLFLLMIFTLIELGRLLFVYSAVFTGAREGARYAAAVGNSTAGVPYFADCQGIREAVKKIGILAGIQDGDITISYDNPDYPSTPAIGCDDPDLTDKVGMEYYQYNRVLVSVTINYQPIAPLVNIPVNLPITTSVGRTIVRDLEIAGVGQYPTPLPPIPPAPTLSACPAVDYALNGNDIEIVIDHSSGTSDIHIKSVSVYWDNTVANNLNEIVYDLDDDIEMLYFGASQGPYVQLAYPGDSLPPTDLSEDIPTEFTWLDPGPIPPYPGPDDSKIGRLVAAEANSNANKLTIKFAGPPVFINGSLAVEMVFDNNCISQQIAPIPGP